MSTRPTTAATLALVGLVLLTGCAAGAPVARERGEVAYDPFRAARTDEFVSSTQLLTTMKSPPTQLVVSNLGIDMRVDTQGLEPNGDMSLPVSPFRAGWYEYAAAPNSPSGATVLAAHVDSLAEGRGPFAELRNIAVGTEAVIVDASGVRHTYIVTAVERIEKGAVPWGSYFSLIGEPRLVLITCGGEYDPGFGGGVGRYEDNYIVTAEKVS
ncbi:MAG: hypothetical protein C0444_02595 [Microbacterium sp.]|nr:hypothetical protein [Microbacterium sp.]MBA4344974.1 hypothetical protein [Microbacterium sp.]